jgi:hypothetical protein
MTTSNRFGLPLLALAPIVLAASTLRAQDAIVAPTPEPKDEIAAATPDANDDIAAPPPAITDDERRKAEEEARAASEDDFDREPQDCIRITDIRSTRVLDDQTILFYMRGRDRIYRNYLPRECPGLEREDRYSYKISGSQLCHIDLITVLEQFGTGIRPGYTCALGAFTPITNEEAEDLLAAKQDLGRKRRAIKSKPAELPPPEAAPQPEPAPARE